MKKPKERLEYKEERLIMMKSKEEYAKVLQGQTLSKPEALWYFGNEGEIRNYFKGKKNGFTGNTAKTFKTTLEQYFESIDETVKVGRGKGYKLGKARAEVAERQDDREKNGEFAKELVKKNKEHFLSNQHLYKKHDDEEWLPVNDPEFSYFYYVSNYGNIFSVKNNRVLKNFVNPEGYLITTLSGKNVKGKGLLNHRLVALAFIENPDPENLIIVNHIDGNKSNPYYKNLEWVTPKENSWHAVRTGLRRFGSTCELKYKPKPLSVKIINESELSKSSRVKRKTPLASFLLENLEINKELINNFR